MSFGETKAYTMELLEERIGYRFNDRTLLKQAITHSSFTNEQKIRKNRNYERLEFLGDAVLELVSSEFLFQEQEGMSEGELTKLRASMVCEPSLAFCARDLELGKFMLLGRGEENTGGRRRDSIVSRAFASWAVSSLDFTCGDGVCRSPSAIFSSRATQDRIGPEMDLPTLIATGNVASTTRTTTKIVSMMLRSSEDLNSRWLVSMAMLHF